MEGGPGTPLAALVQEDQLRAVLYGLEPGDLVPLLVHEDQLAGPEGPLDLRGTPATMCPAILLRKA
ncbi:MAG: hypothetical protein ACE5H3_10580 [Planctomycetota bacterium]